MSLHTDPFLFLSYTTADRERALAIAGWLEESGIQVWIDRRAIIGGRRWSAEIAEAIERCSALLLLCSAASLASHNVRQEIQLAWKHRRPYIPLFLEAVSIPTELEYFLEGWQWIELGDLPAREWQPRLLRAIDRLGVDPVQRSEGPSATQAAESPQSSPIAATNLPLQLTSFIGRGKELAELRRLLSESRLVSLVGPGGCGKTRLAIEAARDLRGRYADGVWLVELASLRDPALVPQAVATALGVREEPGSTALDAVVAYLRSHRVLLLLDNCEHLIAACAQLVETLAQSCPAVSLLATSREPLGVAGEAAFRVPALAVPAADQPATAASIGASEAARLFVDRAAVVRPGFVLRDDNAGAIAEICHRVDGIPLAIELAAARMNVLAADQIAAKLSDRFRLLTSGSRTAPSRQQTLRAAIDWSYDLLSAGEQALLQRLSVFAGGLEYAAAEAVCAGAGAVQVDQDDVLDLLSGLVDKSLVQTEEAAGQLRYRLLESVRQYGAEKLEGVGDILAVQDRHLAWFTTLAERTVPLLRGPKRAAWLARLEAEYDNCRAALARALGGDRSGAPAHDPEAALRLAAALQYFWEARGSFREARDWLERALSAGDRVAPRIRAQALQAAGVVARYQGDLTAAVTRLDESLTLRRQLQDAGGIMDSLNSLAIIARRRSEYQHAEAVLQECLALARTGNDRQREAIYLVNLASVAGSQGDQARWRDLQEQALVLFRELGDQQGIAVSLMNLGAGAADAGDFARAAGLLQESLVLARALGSKQTVLQVLFNLANLAKEQHDYARAAQYGREELSLCLTLEDKTWAAAGLECLAGVAAQTGNATAAVNLFGAAAALRQTTGTEVPPMRRSQYGRDLDISRDGLSGDAFTMAWAVGHAMDLATAIDFALKVELPS